MESAGLRPDRAVPFLSALTASTLLLLVGCSAVERTSTGIDPTNPTVATEEAPLEGQDQLDQLAKLHGIDPKTNQEKKAAEAELDKPLEPTEGGDSSENSIAKKVTPEARIAELENRVDTLEQYLKSMNEKLRSQSAQGKFPDGPFPVEIVDKNAKKETSPTDPAITQIRGEPVDTENPNGFINNTSVQTFRRAMVLYRAKRYSDAVVIFTEFIDQNSDHPLASAAQFLLGECYYYSNEPRLAYAEYQKSILAYDKGTHFSHSLARLHELAVNLGEKDKAAVYQQQLLSQFPSSPANHLAKSKLLPTVIPMGETQSPTITGDNKAE